MRKNIRSGSVALLLLFATAVCIAGCATLKGAAKGASEGAKEDWDAMKRWKDKGHGDKFDAWVMEFYEKDHPQWIARTLLPIAQAMDGHHKVGDLLQSLEVFARGIRHAPMGDFEAWMEAYPPKLAVELMEAIED